MENDPYQRQQIKNDAQSDDISANRHNPNTNLKDGDLGKVHFFQKK